MFDQLKLFFISPNLTLHYLKSDFSFWFCLESFFFISDFPRNLHLFHTWTQTIFWNLITSEPCRQKIIRMSRDAFDSSTKKGEVFRV